MKTLTLLLLLSAGLGASAATIGIPGENPGITVTHFNGQFLNSNAWVRIGFFRNLNTAGLNGCEVLEAINQNFVPLGEPASPPGYGTPAGNTAGINPAFSTLSGAITDLTFGTGAANTEESGFVPRGTRLFILIYDDRLTPTGLGIFSATSWIIPQSTLINTVALLPSSVNTPEAVFYGGLGSLVLAGYCPEPGTAALAMVAVLGLAVQRRRLSRSL